MNLNLVIDISKQHFSASGVILQHSRKRDLYFLNIECHICIIEDYIYLAVHTEEYFTKETWKFYINRVFLIALDKLSTILRFIPRIYVYQMSCGALNTS